jgi:Mce-associated membrane protein
MEVDAHRPDAGALSPKSTTSGPGAVRTILALLALLLPVALGVALWLWQDNEHSTAAASAKADSDAVKAATAQALTWASVDYRKTDEYFAAVEKGATGKFLQEFKQSEEPLSSLLTENKSVQVPTIPKDGAGLVERDGDTARVIVALDATVSNTSTATPQPRQYRLQLTLANVDGTWKTNNLEFVS